MARLVLDQVVKYLGGRPVVRELDLAIESGELICLLGPSGCGKTTTLRMIAGFLVPDRGRILLDDKPITHLPPERRPTAMVFQQYALWPHMDVFHNIAFGLQLRRLSRQQVRDRVHNVLKLVRLEGYERAYPAHLSGGQQQRVALARALVLEPHLLLLDEPLSNLDTRLREQVREEIREIQLRVGITTIFVTHDQDEALSISDRVAVMAEGRLEQYAAPDVLYREPATLFVASFIGTMNIYSGTLCGQAVEIDGTPVPCQQYVAPGNGPVEIAVRPEDVRLTADENAGVVSRLKQRIPRGHYQELVLAAPFGSVRAFVGNDVTIDEQVRFFFQHVLVYRKGSLIRETVSQRVRGDSKEID
ncbi:MAG: ABC transporter ATP-binding protein [Ktedonobacteraceae bacterium]|nr:ABC transporter ATP-binding protein [Ktedonobacteraceae bacterium]